MSNTYINNTVGIKIGALVKIIDVNADDSRRFGTIIKFDRYFGNPGYHPQKHNLHGEDIVEVLWSNGELGWILKQRLKAINESR